MLHYLLCKTLSETRETHFLCFEHHGETIDHGGYEGLENNLKLGVLLAVIDLFDEVVQYADDQLLLLVTWEFLELLRFHHETYQDRGDIFLCETIIDVLYFEFFDSLHETLGIDLSVKFL